LLIQDKNALQPSAKLIIADMNEEGGHQTVHMIT